MIQSTNKYQISEIFGIDNKVKYVIPKFQREYIWTKDEWENLFNDLMENDNGYFLGTIICVDKGTDALAIKPLEVIDGQQRLTAISLLYCAIYSRLKEEEEKKEEKRVDEEFITEKNNLKYRLIQKGENNALKLELSYQNNNLEDYRAILNKVELYNGSLSKSPNLGNRRIYKTYKYFKDKISDFDYNKLKNFLDKINSAILVKIQVDTNYDAFILFESLNNRGIPLSAIDLIKNNILSELEKKNPGQIDNAFNEWIKLVDNLPDYSIQERFLRQYYNAFRYNDDIKIQGTYKATRSNLIKIYDKLIEKKPDFIFEELITKSDIYKEFITPSDKEVYFKSLIDLAHIGGAPSYTFLLYLFSEYKGKNNELLKGVIEFLVKYFVRRHLTDYPSTRDLDTIFIELIDECEKEKGTLNLQSIISQLTDPKRFANIKIFEDKLKGNIYEDNVEVTRFILCKIEETHQTKEIFTDLWKKDEKDRFIWTIEHIFPEGEDIPEEWLKMIANGNVNEAKKLQGEWVHKLGNLTLTGYNPNLSNLSFEEKRDRTDKKRKYIGYNNGLYLNKDLAKKESWTTEDIKDRTDELVKEALTLFGLESEKGDMPTSPNTA